MNRTVNKLELNIEELRKLCSERKFKWTTHILMRLQQREINPSDVKNCIMSGEIIEQYPQDHPHPSCLILGLCVNGQPLHTVIGCGAGYLWLITAYRPNQNEWESDLKTRKGR